MKIKRKTIHRPSTNSNLPLISKSVFKILIIDNKNRISKVINTKFNGLNCRIDVVKDLKIALQRMNSENFNFVVVSQGLLTNALIDTEFELSSQESGSNQLAGLNISELSKINLMELVYKKNNMACKTISKPKGNYSNIQRNFPSNKIDKIG
jgi:hypothetical protein